MNSCRVCLLASIKEGMGGAVLAGFFERIGTRILVSSAMCWYMTLRSSAGRLKKVNPLELDDGSVVVDAGVAFDVTTGTLLRRVEEMNCLLLRLMFLNMIPECVVRSQSLYNLIHFFVD
jgi:hypothetical protein